MKQAFLFIALLATLSIMSCGKKESGHLVGVADRPKWKGVNPYGMVYVPSGTLFIGTGDEDVSGTFVQRPKSVSIQGFYMDDTEITNNEYRQFVYWVRDSIARGLQDLYTEDDDGNQSIDWEADIDWEDTETLSPLFVGNGERIAGRKEYSTGKLSYTMDEVDWQKAAHDRKASRASLINKENVAIYPDTLCWIRDFAYSYNEPMTRNYFWHPAFDDYPTVGVNWKQAKAFCHWRTKLWNKYNGTKKGVIQTEEFRLPFESEWEYAARGGHELAPYPWGGYYTRNAKGCLLANFKPGRGNYPEDGGMFTVKSTAYFPNDYGLYNMAGNVAEWTETPFYENAYSFYHDMNPSMRYNAKKEDPESLKRKVVRGGSWKDVAYFLQTGVRSWEYQDTTKSYVGFRCALTFLGRSVNDFK